MTIITCAICQRQRKHHTRGLCNACACWARSVGILEIFSLGRRAPAGQSRRAEYWREYKRNRAWPHQTTSHAPDATGPSDTTVDTADAVL